MQSCILRSVQKLNCEGLKLCLRSLSALASIDLNRFLPVHLPNCRYYSSSNAKASEAILLRSNVKRIEAIVKAFSLPVNVNLDLFSDRQRLSSG